MRSLGVVVRRSVEAGEAIGRICDAAEELGLDLFLEAHALRGPYASRAHHGVDARIGVQGADARPVLLQEGSHGHHRLGVGLEQRHHVVRVQRYALGFGGPGEDGSVRILPPRLRGGRQRLLEVLEAGPVEVALADEAIGPLEEEALGGAQS